jgi:acyl transferase domain-containing protein
VIKMVEALGHEELPPTLHVDEPSPHVDWQAGEVELLREPRPWPRGERPRRAGVSSFGVSGTNAHLIVEEPPTEPAVATDAAESDTGEPGAEPGVLPWILSARTEPALRAQAGRLRAHVEAHPELDPRDVAHSLLTTRARLERRLAVVGSERAALLAGLDAAARSQPAPNLVEGAALRPGKLCFVFPGQGSQWPGMARALVTESELFRARMRDCEAALAPYVDFSLAELIERADAQALERVEVVQPALFAVMVSLAELWRSFGVEPALVAGHSQGEIAAAAVCGALSLEDAARVVALRSKAVADELAGHGGMVSLAAPLAAVEARIERYGERLALAAVNGARSVVVSGEPAALEELLADCGRDDLRARRIAVDYASHSQQVERIRARLLEELAPITPRAAAIPFYSTVTATPLEGTELDAEYWYRALRQAVRFEPATRALIDAGARAFVEVSPHPVLGLALQETIDATDGAGRVAVLASLRRDEGGLERFTSALAEAHVGGVEVDFAPLTAGAQRVPLPTYAFERRRYWLSPPDGAAAAMIHAGHPPPGAEEVQADVPLAVRLADTPEPEREAVALELVRAHLAVTLGHDSVDAVDPERPFLELGLDSVAAVRLRSRLEAAAGLAAPVSAIFDHPTAAELAHYLVTHADELEEKGDVAALAEPAGAPAPASNGASRNGTGTMGALLREAFARGAAKEFLDTLMAASSFRPAFDADSDADVRSVRLSGGASTPKLICIPSLVATAGPHEYVKLARSFRERREVSALPLPGYLEGERLPQSIEAVAAALADAAQRHAEGAPFALVGHSSGGWLAHAVASHIEAAGESPASVVLVDTYPPDHERTAEWMANAVGEVLGGSDAFGSVSDERLTAMGAYLRLFADWHPAELGAPTVLLRATDPMPGFAQDDGAGQASWPLPHEPIQVPGNHFTMMQEHADSTAEAVEAWLATQRSAVQP